MIVCVADPAGALESPALLSCFEFDQLVGHRTAMDGTYPIDGCGCCCDVQPETIVAVLFAGESDSRAMDSITAHHVQNLGILFASRSERSSTCGDVVEQIFDCNLSTGIPCTWLWLFTLSRFRRCQLATSIVSLVSTAGVSCPCGHTEMCNMADTRQCFTSEAVCANGGQVFEGF